MKYGDKIIEMHGVIVKVQGGGIGVDFKGRLGHIEIPKRMIITDYPLEVGQKVVFKMSFLEMISPEVKKV
ncbi:CBO2463/CBO2479 domain-containing protein [Cetobacterium sp.]|uniref:CBO2463/CBO2479 domain-containing protein n=1 Tax=Cetobacterium sp. TaxID=2071632 RepID=UPI003AF12A88